MDRSANEARPSRQAQRPFTDVERFSAANDRSKLMNDEVSAMYDKYSIPYGEWKLYPADTWDRIHHNPSIPTSHDRAVTGISEAAFKCGFWVPLIPLLWSLFLEMDIALGQMNPNGFILINVFQLCFLAAEIQPSTRLFWHHHEFKKNSKSPGFYTITCRTSSPDWADTNSSNKGTHDKWFFISGPRITLFNRWYNITPNIIKTLPYPGRKWRLPDPCSASNGEGSSIAQSGRWLVICPLG